MVETYDPTELATFHSLSLSLLSNWVYNNKHEFQHTVQMRNKIKRTHKVHKTNALSERARVNERVHAKRVSVKTPFCFRINLAAKTILILILSFEAF